MLVMLPEGGIDPVRYHMLQTTLTLDDALNLEEIDAVQQSWHAATRRNDDAINKIIQDRELRKRAR